MGTKKSKDERDTEWKKIKFDLSRWFFDNKFEQWRKDNGFSSVAAGVRYIINQFFKDKHY